MISFSQEVKNQILSKEVKEHCCALAWLLGIVASIGSLVFKKEGITFSISTDNPKLIDRVANLIKFVYGKTLNMDVFVTTKTAAREKTEVEIPVSIGYQLLKDIGILYLDKNLNTQIYDGIDHHIIMEDCCKIAYVSACFVSAGTVSIPQTGNDDNMTDYGKNSGYHLEVELSSDKQAGEFAHILATFDILSKKVVRKEHFVIYIKESDAISDLLGLMGATDAVLLLQGEKVKRDMRNQINRQTNCINANIGKSVDAGIKQYMAIETIKNTIGLDALPDPLKKVANIRLKNKQASLSEIIELSGENVTRGGMNYRFKKIVEIAKNITGD